MAEFFAEKLPFGVVPVPLKLLLREPRRYLKNLPVFGDAIICMSELGFLLLKKPLLEAPARYEPFRYITPLVWRLNNRWLLISA